MEEIPIANNPNSPVPSYPSNPSSFKIPLLAVFVIGMMGLSSLITYLILKSPAPIVQVSPTPLPAEASAKAGDPTADWKTYTSLTFKLSFKYPQNWFIEENSNSQNIRIQNYDPSTAPQRGYDPAGDHGKYLLTVTKYIENKKEGEMILSLVDLKKILPKNGETGYYIGDPHEIIVKNEREFLLNGFPAYYREKGYVGLSDITEYQTYLLDEKGNSISVAPGLDINGGKIQTDQILSTFRFAGSL